MSQKIEETINDIFIYETHFLNSSILYLNIKMSVSRYI